MKRTLIIGNGFDLDAGLHTSYRDFAKSEYWPFKGAQQISNFNTLAYELDQATFLNTWFDVEETLYLYAKKEIAKLTLAGGKIEAEDKRSFDFPDLDASGGQSCPKRSFLSLDVKIDSLHISLKSNNLI